MLLGESMYKNAGKFFDKTFMADKYQSIFLSAFFVLLFIATFSVSGGGSAALMLEGASPLDTSWQLVLEYAAGHGWQFGKDIVFTYGPLGYLFTGVSQGHFLTARIAFAFLWSLYVAWASFGVARELTGATRYLFAAWVLFFGTFSGGIDQFTFLVILYCGYLFLKPNSGMITATAFLVMLPVLSLAKFTFCIASLVVVLIVGGSLAINRNYRRAAYVVVMYGVLLALLWLATGQQLGNLPSWLNASWEISSGYVRAMSRPADIGILVLSIIALLIFLTSFYKRIKTDDLTPVHVGFYLLLTMFVYLAWKQGFVRAAGHTHAFILFLPTAFAFLSTDTIGRKQDDVIALSHTKQFIAVIALCAVAMFIRTDGDIGSDIVGKPLDVLSRLSYIAKTISGNAHHPALNSDRKMAREFELPTARSLIGNGTVDVINFQQWAAILNHLNYHPRPVIQGYSAYTDYLEALNRSFFEGSRRPQFLLFNLETIDNRFPTLDDAATLPLILLNYKIIGSEKDFLIMQENGAEHRPLRLKLIHEQVVGFGELLDMAPYTDKILVMRADIRPTLWGKLVGFLYHAPIVSMDIMAGGTRFNKRIVPGMASGGFLLNPVLLDNEDVAGFYQNQGTPVEGIIFKRPVTAFGQLSDTITVKLYRIEK